MISESFSHLVKLGYGVVGSGETHPSFGMLLWVFKDELLDLRIYRLGFVSVESSHSNHAVLFTEIEHIESRLTVEYLAQASKNYTGNERLPMDIRKFNGERFEIKVPLAFYSTLLQSLIASCGRQWLERQRADPL